MQLHRTALIPLAVLVLLSGCSVVRRVFEAQPSENVALMEGTRANHPGLIDGDLRIPGSSDPPTDETAIRGMMAAPTEAVVLLPIERTITRIVVHSDEIVSLDLLFETATSGWVHHRRYEGLSGPRIELTPRGLISASGVKLSIRKGTGDGGKRTIERMAGVDGFTGVTDASVEIMEIEVFGPVRSLPQ